MQRTVQKVLFLMGNQEGSLHPAKGGNLIPHLGLHGSLYYAPFSSGRVFNACIHKKELNHFRKAHGLSQRWKQSNTHLLAISICILPLKTPASVIKSL